MLPKNFIVFKITVTWKPEWKLRNVSYAAGPYKCLKHTNQER